MKLKNVFQRREVKYTLTFDQFRKLLGETKGHLIQDQYGLHTIYSLYYDTCNYDMIKKSIDKPTYKEKFRVRSYGKPKLDSSVFFEIKKKVNGIVYKRRVEEKYSHLNIYDASDKIFLQKESQIQREISYLFSKNTLEPKVLIAYDRRAFYTEEDENFRVTFDLNIRYSLDDLNFSEANMNPVSPEVDVLMEVKSLGAYPLWFSSSLSKFGIHKASYSKYANVYKRHIFKKLQEEKIDEELEKVGYQIYA